MAVAITRPNTADITGVAASGNVASYTSIDIGTAAADRIVVVCIGTELASSVPTACTINSGGGAVSMTAAEAATQGAVNSHIFYLGVPTGTTATIAVTFGATNPTDLQNHIAVYRVVGANGTPTDTGFVADTDADPISSGALTVPTNGGGIAICSDATDTTARTWTGFTKDLDADAGSFRFSTGTGTASATITVSGGNNEDGAISWIIFGPIFTPSQAAFRFYEAGTESGATASAAQDTNVADIDGNLFDTGHIRFRIQETAGASGATTDDYDIVVSINSGAYTTDPTSKLFFAESGLTSGGATTERLTGGTGTFVAGKQNITQNSPLNFQLTASNFTEHVWGWVLNGDNVANNDTIDFRVRVRTDEANYQDINYAVTPRMTIKRSNLSQDAFRFYLDGTESGSTAIATQNTNITHNTTTTPIIHVRFRIQENNNWANDLASDTTRMVVSKNSGTYTTLDASDWINESSSGLAHGEATTNRLGAGTGSFYAGLQSELSNTATFGDQVYAAGNYTEYVIAIRANSGDAFTNGTTYDFKLIRLGRAPITEFDAYNQVPRVTVTGGVAKSLVFTPNAYFNPLIVR